MSLKVILKVAGLVLIVTLMALNGQGRAPAAGQTPANPQPSPSFKENDEIPGPLRQSTFIFVWEKIRDEYYDPTFGGIDWTSVKEKFVPQIADAKTSGAFHSLLGQMLRELGRSHLGITAPHQMIREVKVAPEVRMMLEGVVFRIVEGRVTAYSVQQESPAWQAGLRAGDVVLRLGDKPLAAGRRTSKRIRPGR